MWQLIKRDVIIQKLFMLIFIPFLVFFIWMDIPSILTFIVASIYIPFNALIYDASASTHMLLNSLPYKRSEIIAARYLGSLLYAVLSMALTMGIMLIMSSPFTWEEILVAFVALLLITAISYPILYSFDSRHLPTIMMISLMLLLIGTKPLMWVVTENFTIINNWISNTSINMIVSLVASGAICIFLISWLFTTKVYERRSF